MTRTRRGASGGPVYRILTRWPTTTPDWSWGRVIAIFADVRGDVEPAPDFGMGPGSTAKSGVPFSTGAVCPS